MLRQSAAMVEFIGRTAELGVLERAYGSARSEFIPIYGRRRVGKSELVLRFMKDKPGVYYVGQQSSAALQVGEFLEEAARALGMPLLAELRADDWARALVTVVDQWTSANSDSGTKLVLALDEFQWIEASSPGLIDPLLRFWFRFVFPNMSVIRSAGAERAFGERIAPSLDAWFGECFERLCRQALPFIYASEGVVAGFEIGEFWNAKTQIDVVGMREDNWTDLGECRWGAVRSARALEAELEGRVERYPNSRGATLGRRYFVRRIPASKKGARGWHSLVDLYALDAP